MTGDKTVIDIDYLNLKTEFYKKLKKEEEEENGVQIWPFSKKIIKKKN